MVNSFQAITTKPLMIKTEQNTEKQIQRLAAQRQLYATAKTIFGWQVILGGPVAVGAAFLVMFNSEMKGYVAIWGIGVALSDLFWLTPWQKRLKDLAARTQESFDCEVLGLPWNSIKAGNYPDPELIKEQSDKYTRWADKMTPLENWYPVIVDDLPLHIARLVCQRSNCWWDAKQRRRYAVWLLGIVIFIFVVVLATAFKGGLTSEDFFLKVVAPLSPALLLGLRQFSEHQDAANRLDRLKVHIESIWNQALAGKSESEVTVFSRSLQDEIYENRRKSPPVLDFIFRKLRRNYEIQMNHAAAQYIGEAKVKARPNNASLAE